MVCNKLLGKNVVEILGPAPGGPRDHVHLRKCFGRASSVLGSGTRWKHHLRQLGAKIDALRVALPAPLNWYLHHIRKYDLHSASLGLTGLSNSLGARDNDTVRFRVQAQRGLRLPIDPEEREQIEREQRLEGITF